MKYITIFFLLLASCSLWSQNLNDGLLLNYLFSNNYDDSSGNYLDGIPKNSGFGEDRFGNENGSLYLDGSGYVELPNADVIKPNFPFTISTWVKVDEFGDTSNTTAFPIIDLSYRNNTYGGAMSNIISVDNEIYAASSYFDKRGCTSSQCRQTKLAVNDLAVNKWHNYISVFNSPTDFKIYINGCLQSSTLSGRGGLEIHYLKYPGVIGKSDFSSISSYPISYFKGYIDDLYIWNRAISEKEIDLLFGDYYDFSPRNISIETSDEDFSIQVKAETYDKNNPKGIEQFDFGYGCDSLISIDIDFIEIKEPIITNKTSKKSNFEVIENKENNIIVDPKEQKKLTSNDSFDSMIKEIPDQLKERKTNLSENIIYVESNVVELEIFDHQLIDGDTVSVNFNGDWILEDFPIKGKPYPLKVKLNKEGKNYLLLHAINLGRKPPNTMAVRYSYRGQKQTVVLSSNLDESEVIELKIVK